MARGSLALARESGPRRLRVGVFADARAQPRWLVEGLARVAQAGFAEVALLCVGALPRRRDPPLMEAYRRLDRAVFGGEPSEATDLAAALPQAALLEIDGAPVPGATELLVHDLDVALALGEFDDTPLDGVARLGVWRFDLDGFGEVAEGAPVTGARLLARLAAGEAPRIAYESWSRTYPLSPARNRREVLHKGAEFAWRALRKAHHSGRPWLEQCRVAGKSFPAEKTFSLASAMRIGARMARRAAEKALAREQWFLAYRVGEGAPEGSLPGFTRLAPPAGRDWADPFPIEKSGRWYVFFEESQRAEDKAHIAVLEIDREGRASAPVRVLCRDYRLSYPFVFEHAGELYMVPETAQNRTVELYRCVDFPLGWKREAVLLEGVRLADPTLHRGPDRWWLFANAAAGESRVFDDELHLFHAPRLQGPWQPHASNPVKSDARGARPAGRLFWRNGALHRPAQVCAPRFGAGIALQRVLRLAPHEYAERQVSRILPQAGSGLLGLHTMNRAGALLVVDALGARGPLSRFAYR